MLEYKEVNDFAARFLGACALVVPGYFLPGLKCKVGMKTVALSNNLNEEQAAEILVALCRTLPTVYRQLCNYPEEKKHLITLGLR
jgi:hypothetical protein